MSFVFRENIKQINGVEKNKEWSLTPQNKLHLVLMLNEGWLGDLCVSEVKHQCDLFFRTDMKYNLFAKDTVVVYYRCPACLDIISVSMA